MTRMTSFHRKKLFPIIALILSAPFLAGAQTASVPPTTGTTMPASPPTGTVSCFDYYNFGSVQAKLTTPVSSAVSGTAITFSGTLENSNPYPVVDGALYVKVFKERGSTNDGNGPDVVEQFLVRGDIAIPAKGSVPISFSWKVPSYAQSGNYQIATFFTTSRKFNLLGLSFTDDVVGNVVPFKVVGEQTSGVAFDKTGETVNGAAYHFAAFPPRVSKDGSVAVAAKVANMTDGDAKANVRWEIYQWDGQLRENMVQEALQSVSVPAHSSKTVSITVSDVKYPVYLAVATLSWNDTKSVIGVRFVREGVDRTRINFPGILSFPLKAGEESTLFSCLHNAGQSPSVPGGRLDLTLSDLSGNVIHEYSYTGEITGAMMGVAEKFTPKNNYDYFTLDARLYSGDQFVDEAHLVYDCNQIDPATCMSGETSIFDMFGNTMSIALYILGALVLLALLVVLYRRVTRRVETTYPPRL